MELQNVKAKEYDLKWDKIKFEEDFDIKNEEVVPKLLKDEDEIIIKGELDDDREEAINKIIKDEELAQKVCSREIIMDSDETIDTNPRCGDEEIKNSNCNLCLDEHLERRPCEKAVPRDSCNNNISTGKSNSMESSIKKRSERFKCSKCDFRSIMKSVVWKHMLTYHGGKPVKLDNPRLTDMSNPVQQKPKQKPIHTMRNFKCLKCNFKSGRNSDLVQHMESHVEATEFPYKCRMCSFKTAQRHIFADHVEYHRAQNPFEYATFYNECKKKLVNFRQILHIKDLYSSHSNVLANNSNFVVDNEIDYDEKPYGCHICSFKFTEKELLDQHLLTHNNQDSDKCGDCNYQCAFKQYLLSSTFKDP